MLICTSMNMWLFMSCDGDIYFVVREYNTKRYFLKESFAFVSRFLSGIKYAHWDVH